MDTGEVENSGRRLLGTLGCPPKNPQVTVPMDAEMQKGMAAISAHIKAQRAKAQPDLNTPEGLEKAAELRLVELRRKECDWLSRVIFDRGNGWKPIWGNAEDEELRIYTLLDSGEHRFWGIKPVGMTIDDFWDKYDPEVRRYDDRQQETPVDPDAPTGPLIGEPPRNPPPPHKTALKPKERQMKRQKTPEINPTHRVQKSTKKSPKIRKTTRKSLANKVGTGDPRLQHQVRDVSPRARADGRSTRAKTAVAASGVQQKPATADGPLAPLKHPRGRPPLTRKLAEELPKKKKKAPVVKGSARVTKSSQTEQRSSAPSTHKMRTRGKGPAELLQLP